MYDTRVSTDMYAFQTAEALTYEAQNDLLSMSERSRSQVEHSLTNVKRDHEHTQGEAMR